MQLILLYLLTVILVVAHGDGQVAWDSLRIGIAVGVSRRSGMSGTVVGQTVYGFGGWDGRYGQGDIYEYDIATKTVTFGSSEGNFDAEYLASATYNSRNNNIYIYGGTYIGIFFSCFSHLDTLYEYSTTLKTMRLLNTTNAPPPRVATSLVYYPIKDILIVYGGAYQQDGCTPDDAAISDMFQYNFTSNSWSPLIASNAPYLTSPSAAIYKDGMYVFGGVNIGSTYTYFNDLYVYNITLNTWARLTPTGEPPSPRCCGVMVSWKNFLIVQGGSNFETVYNDIYFYDVDQNTWGKSNVLNPIYRTRHIGGLTSTGTIAIFGGLSNFSNTNSAESWGFQKDVTTFAGEIVFEEPSSVGSESARKSPVLPGVGVAVAIVVLVILVVVAYFGFVACRKRQYRKHIHSSIELAEAPSGKVNSMLKMNEIQTGSIIIGEKLGEGFFGSVYRGNWQGTDVALKKLNTDAAVDDEIKILGSLNHPNILRFLGVYTYSGEKYMVTEFVRRGSLDKFLQNSTAQMSTEDILDIAIQISSGMIYLEKNRVIHRDLAARNILVTLEDTKMVAKVADFGLSKDVQAQAEYSQKVAVRWSPIELFNGAKWTHKGDVWSLGVVFWEMVQYSREVPYNGMNNQELITKLREGYRLPQPHGCPDSLYKLMIDCWKENPEERPTFEVIYKRLHAMKELLPATPVLQPVSNTYQFNSVVPYASLNMS